MGSVLVMDGDVPNFVILSYDNYKNLVQDNDLENIVNQQDRRSSGGIGIDPIIDSDEERIKILNDEVALLREDIKQREIQEVLAED